MIPLFTHCKHLIKGEKEKKNHSELNKYRYKLFLLLCIISDPSSVIFNIMLESIFEIQTMFSIQLGS